MPDRLWKQKERDWAKKVNSHREGPTGKLGPDIKTSWAEFEVKQMTTFRFAEVKHGLAQIMATGDKDKLKAVVVYLKGSTDPLVIMTGSEFLAWTGADLRGNE